MGKHDNLSRPDLGVFTVEEIIDAYKANGRSLERTAMAVPFSASTLSRVLNQQVPEILRPPWRPAVDEETINKIAELAELGEATIGELARAHGTSESTYYRYLRNRAR